MQIILVLSKLGFFKHSFPNYKNEQGTSRHRRQIPAVKYTFLGGNTYREFQIEQRVSYDDAEDVVEEEERQQLPEVVEVGMPPELEDADAGGDHELPVTYVVCPSIEDLRKYWECQKQIDLKSVMYMGGFCATYNQNHTTYRFNVTFVG